MKKRLTLNQFFLIVTLLMAAFIGGATAFIASNNAILTSLETSLLFGACGLLALLFLYILYRSSLACDKELGILKEVFMGSRAAKLITDMDGRILYHNTAFSKLTSHEVLAQDILFIRDFAKVFEQEETAFEEFRLLLENAERGASEDVTLSANIGGQQEWLHINVQPIFGWAGYLHWRIDNITDQFVMESTIREERAKLIRFTENAPVGFFSVDDEGRFQFVNATFARWLEEDVRSLLDKGCLHDYLDKPPKTAHPYDLVEQGGEKQSTELKMRTKSGSRLFVSIQQSVKTDSQGRIRTNAVVHDLTAERKMRSALADSEDRFKRFFEEAPLPIAQIDQSGYLTDHNAAFQTMLETSAKQINNKRLLNLVDKENRTLITQALQNMVEGNNLPAPLDIKLVHGDVQRNVQMHARRFKGSADIVLHFIDQTEQRSLEEQFVQSQKMQAIGQLAGGVAHDFNNLLTAMIGFCDLLLLRHKPGDPSFGDISQIKQNANRASNLVRQLLAFSRQQTLRPKVLDISETLTELSHLLRRLLGANIELDVRHGTDLGLIRVDESQLEQVLINLAVNARDAMMDTDGKKNLLIETKNYRNPKAVKRGADKMPPGNWLAISVTDTGHGIPDDIRDRIFEPFFTTKKVGEGTGLGLATVYGIMRQTDGYIHVESESGKGTTFTLYLPQHDQSSKQEKGSAGAEKVNARDLTGTAKILLVEDEEAVLSFSSRALGNKGYEVYEATSAEEALDVLKDKISELDLLITDVIMPGMDGPTLAKQVMADRPDLRVILMSGYTEDRFKDDLSEKVHFLPKPFTLKQLAEKVKDVLDGE